jgi:hypothetical protein
MASEIPTAKDFVQKSRRRLFTKSLPITCSRYNRDWHAAALRWIHIAVAASFHSCDAARSRGGKDWR